MTALSSHHPYLLWIFLKRVHSTDLKLHRFVAQSFSIMPSSSALITSIRRPSEDTAAAGGIPILVDNEYHLFHLTTPPSTIHHPERLRSSWSRLRSNCLSQWSRNDKFALTPGKSPEAPDADGIWTGSAIIGPDGNMHIIYTAIIFPKMESKSSFTQPPKIGLGQISPSQLSSSTSFLTLPTAPLLKRSTSMIRMSSIMKTKNATGCLSELDWRKDRTGHEAVWHFSPQKL